jgi:RNA polymerase sigma-70 factor (ECF subfamily)
VAAAVDVSGSIDPTLEQSDEELVDALRQGDRAAFDALYDRYFKRVFGFTEKRLHNRADAEETTQEVFITVLGAIDSYRGDAPFAAWVFGITRRTIAGRFKRKRHATVPLVDQEPEPNRSGGPEAGPSPIELLEVRERLAQLEETLEHKLSAEQRMLFRLHHLEDRPISEIASRLDKTEDAVKSHLYRARRLLLQR